MIKFIFVTQLALHLSSQKADLPILCRSYSSQATTLDERRGSRPRSMVRSFTMPSTPRPLSVASVSSISSDSTPSRPGSDGYVLQLM